MEEEEEEEDAARPGCAPRREPCGCCCCCSSTEESRKVRRSTHSFIISADCLQPRRRRAPFKPLPRRCCEAWKVVEVEEVAALTEEVRLLL